MFYNDEFRQDVAYGLDNDIDINITNQNVNSNDIMNGYDALFTWEEFLPPLLTLGMVF